MKVVILCAGLGNRLMPLTKEVPKPLIQVGGKTILDRQLESISHLEVEEVIIVTGYLSEKIISHIDFEFISVVNQHYSITNSMYSLWLARNYLHGHSFLLLNGDIISNKNTISRIVSDKQISTSLVIKKPNYVLGEMNVVIEDENIKEIGKDIDPNVSNGESGQISFINSDDSKIFFERMKYFIIDKKEKNYFPAKAYDNIISDSTIKPIFDNEELWLEIDTIEDLKKARDFYEKK